MITIIMSVVIIVGLPARVCRGRNKFRLPSFTIGGIPRLVSRGCAAVVSFDLWVFKSAKMQAAAETPNRYIQDDASVNKLHLTPSTPDRVMKWYHHAIVKERLAIIIYLQSFIRFSILMPATFVFINDKMYLHTHHFGAHWRHSPNSKRTIAKDMTHRRR